MVPNPFRLISRVLPGGGGSENETSEEPPAQQPPATGTGESPRSAEESGTGATAAEHDAAAEAHESPEEVDSERHEDADSSQPEDAEEIDSGGHHEPEAADSSEHHDSEEIDASGIPAPSIGPHTKITQEDPEKRLARHEQSDVDAMGQDKRREVIGGSYGASFAKQATLYGIFLLVVGLLVVGAILAVNEFDQPPEEEKLEAPWKDSTDPADASQIDFPPDSAPEQVPSGPDPTSKGGSDRA